MPEFKVLLTRSEDLLKFLVSRRMGYSQNAYNQRCTTSCLLVEETPYLGKGLLVDGLLIRTVDNQLKILISIGTAIIIVAAPRSRPTAGFVLLNVP